MYAPMGNGGVYEYVELWYGFAVKKESDAQDYAVEFLRFMARQDELNTLASIKGVPSAARLQSVSDQIPFGCIGFYIISRPQLPQSQGHTLQLPFADLVQELNPHCRFRFVSLQAAIQRYLPENRTLGECCFWLKESTLSTNRNFEFWMIEFILLKIVHRSMNH